ncbi:MAG: phosphoribosylamine--glycine ligase [Candidatus Syntropharchaeia archaeon]
MKVLVVGAGGREHAIAKSLAESARIYGVMNNRNPGIASLCDDWSLGDINDVKRVLSFALESGVDFAVIGPEDPLKNGISDTLEEKGIPCIGPRRDPARLEWDKGFARELMKKHKILAYPEFGVFSDANEAKKFIKELENVAVKPAGLTAGKGVKVVGRELKDEKEAEEYAKEIIERKIGGLEKVIIEEKLEGEEFTLQCFTDGRNVVPTPLVQDHKNAYDGDVGPMTGGMGSYSDSNGLLPFIEKEEKEEALEIIKKTIRAIKEETGIPYVGIIYGGFILTEEGPKILEYNCRFGDPEAMNILPILREDLTEIFMSMIQTTLKDISFEEKATVCRYVVPRGYPVNPLKDARIEIGEIRDALLFYGSVNEKDGNIYTTSSRSLALVGIGDSISEAEKKVESGLSCIRGEVEYRHDIGKEELIKKRIEHMKSIRKK